jgi:hypothetical protein
MKNNFLKKFYWLILQNSWQTNDDAFLFIVSRKMSTCRSTKGNPFWKAPYNNNRQIDDLANSIKTINGIWQLWVSSQWLLEEWTLLDQLREIQFDETFAMIITRWWF